MRIPWKPLEQGGGAHGPTLAERIFVGAAGQPDYGTASNHVERKAFMNLPMPCKDAMNIYEPNLHKGPPKGARGMIGSSVRKNGEGAGENYVDSFVTHPIAGNYEKLFAGIEEQKKEAELERVPQLTLEMVARRGFTNLGLNADEERMNSLRDRLRFMGASDEEIETQLKDARQKKLREMVGREMIPEQREQQAADAFARNLGVHPEQTFTGANTFTGPNKFTGTRIFHDGNVFNFGTPAPARYGVPRDGPDNSEFVPSGAQDRGHGVHSIEVLPSDEERVRRGRAGGKPQVQGVQDRTDEAQLALTRRGPELIGRNAQQIRSQIEFAANARRIYDLNLERLLSKKAEYEEKVARARNYKEKRYPLQQLRKITDDIVGAQGILAAIEAGRNLPMRQLRGPGRPRRV
jgi:hypothetical protein